jgi:prephenate dehydrogenase
MTVDSGRPIRVGIIGLGLIGGSILRRLAERSSQYVALGFDTDPSTRTAVEDQGFTLASSAADVANAADVVIIAVPPHRTAEAVVYALNANPLAFVTDVASVKTPILKDVRARSPDALDRFLPSHPLAGAETTGWRSARAGLLDTTIWAICPPYHGAPAELLCRCAAVFGAFDARLIVCDPVEHDLAVARTSHAPHVVAEVIASSLARDPAKLVAALSGGGFRDMMRVARSDANLWSDIVQMNRDPVIAVIDEWVADLEELRAAIGECRRAAVTDAWQRGGKALDLVEQLRWQPPNWEQQVFEWPAWEDLLALGREGRSIRRVGAADGCVSAEVSASAVGREPADSRRARQAF